MIEFNFILNFLDLVFLQGDLFGIRGEGPLGTADPLVKGMLPSVFAVIGFSIMLNLFNAGVRKKLVDSVKMKRIMNYSLHPIELSDELKKEYKVVEPDLDKRNLMNHIHSNTYQQFKDHDTNLINIGLWVDSLDKIITTKKCPFLIQGIKVLTYESKERIHFPVSFYVG